MSDLQLVRNRRKPGIGRPQTAAADDGRRQKVDVNPTDAAPVEAPVPNKLDDLLVGDRCDLMHSLVVGQQPLPSPAVAHQEFSKDEFMAQDLAVLEKFVQSSAKGVMAGEELDPDGGVDQDH